MRPTVRFSCLLVVFLITGSLFGVLFASAALPLTTMPLSTVSPALPPSPSSTPEWHVEYFRLDSATSSMGDCVVLAYWVVGAKSLTLSRTNPTTEPELITDNPNVRTVCPSQAEGYAPGYSVVYTLDIIYLDGRTESRSIDVTGYWRTS